VVVYSVFLQHHPPTDGESDDDRGATMMTEGMTRTTEGMVTMTEGTEMIMMEEMMTAIVAMATR